MKPMAAAVGAALISGVAMYTVGARTAEVDAFARTPAAVDPGEARYVPTGSINNLQPVAAAGAPAARRVAIPERTVYRVPAPVQDRASAERQAQPKRSWGKTAMIVGGSAASGAAVGGIVDGKKGALIGAAIGGGAASIYEATRR